MPSARTAPHPAAGSRVLRRAAAPVHAGGGAAAVAPPLDVRLMNAVVTGIATVLLLGALAAGLQWLSRAPLFTLRTIELAGDLQRNSVPTLRANATPRLAGNFFSVDLQQARAAFEAVPWVRRAEVRRVWPDRLLVVLEEHRPAALWEAAPMADAEGADGGGEQRLVNSHGEVFDANVGDVEDEGLPTLAGPEGTAAEALALYRRIAPAFARLDWTVQRVSRSGRGSWRLELDSGASVELGRGSEDEVVARTERFVRTLTQVTARWRQPLEYADLRHADGYAIRLAGVTTTPPAATPPRNP